MTADAWFPEAGQPNETTKRVKEICRACPVRLECRELGKSEVFGIWGGLHKRERRAIKTPVIVRNVSPVGSQRKLQALARLGWGGREIALDIKRYVGMSVNPKSLDSLRSGNERSVPEDVADAISRAYKHLRCSTSPAPSSKAVAERAVQSGWPSPRSWRGKDIEDPKAVPGA